MISTINNDVESRHCPMSTILSTEGECCMWVERATAHGGEDGVEACNGFVVARSWVRAVHMMELSIRTNTAVVNTCGIPFFASVHVAF